MSVAEELAKEVVRTKFEDIPQKAVERTRRGIFDTIGVTFLGYPNAGKPFIDYAKSMGVGPPESTIIGDGSKTSCMYAAGVNAQMAQSTDFTEIGPGHSALTNMVQTSIAVAERVGASGKDLITAVALAYEINGRFHRAAYPLELIRGEGLQRDNSFIERGSHRHHPASAAITAAKLLGLIEAQVYSAIGIAWHYTPLRSGRPSGLPSVAQRGEAQGLETCHWGIQAALLAQNDFGGPPDVVENEEFYDLNSVVSSPSPFYYAGNELHLKPWISSRGTHPGLSAMLDIVKEERIRPEEIEEVRFKAKRLYMQHPFDNPEPLNYREAVNSIPWAFAMALLGYEAGPEWLTERRLKDPKARALSKKVKILELPRATEIWESGVKITNDGPNEVEVVVKGKVFAKARTYGESPGSSLNPMPLEWLERKFKANATPVIGQGQSEQLVDALSKLENQSDIKTITRLFKPF